MIELENLDSTFMTEIGSLIVKNIEKSEFEKLFLFSHDVLDKSKIFVSSYRFLMNACNLTQEGKTKETIKKELDTLKNDYIFVLRAISVYDNCSSFRQSVLRNKLSDIFSKNKGIDELIDVFSILIEKTPIIQVSRLKGFVLEGKSEKAYKKTFAKSSVEYNKVENTADEDELTDDKNGASFLEKDSDEDDNPEEDIDGDGAVKEIV